MHRCGPGKAQEGSSIYVRTTVDLDEVLLDRMLRLMPRRQLGRFVGETLAARLDTLQREQRDAMREGYLASRDEGAELAADWAALDSEGWPD